MIIIVLVFGVVGMVLILAGISKQSAAFKIEKIYEVYKADAPEDKFNRSQSQNVLIRFKSINNLLTLNDVPARCQEIIRKGRVTLWVGVGISFVSIACSLYHFFAR